MFGALIGPALSFGSSLLSGLGARQSAKKQQKMQAAYEYQNYMQQQEDNRANRDFQIEYDARRYEIGNDLRDWSQYYRDRSEGTAMVNDANRAGFNPVTWINAMGGMYQQMQAGGLSLLSEAAQYRTPSLWQQQSYMQNAPTAQVPSMMEAVGGALQSGVNTFLSDRRVTQSQDFQREMLQTQISAIQRNGGRPTSAIGVPASQRTFFGSGQLPYAVTAGAAVAGRSPPPPPGQGGYEGDAVKITSPFASLGWYSWPRAPNTEAVGERYGEEGIVQGLTGNVYIPYKDAEYNWNIYKHTGVNFPGLSITPADRNQLGYYPDGARGLSWGRPNGSGAIHPEAAQPKNRIGWPGTSFFWEW